MSERDPQNELLRIARESLDERQLHELLETASNREVDERAVRALQEVAAEELATLALRASRRARHRVRAVEADDVATAAEHRCDPCGDGGDFSGVPLYLDWEGD